MTHLNAMLHDEGDWQEISVAEAEAMVHRGEARELTGKAIAHYDDGMRTFDLIAE